MRREEELCSGYKIIVMRMNKRSGVQYGAYSEQ